MTYPTKEAMAALNQALRLPATGQEQDWDIELADPDRVDEFVACFESHTSSEGEKHALMALILGSLEDLSNREEVSTELWIRVKRLLRADPGSYADLVKHWGPKTMTQTALQFRRCCNRFDRENHLRSLSNVLRQPCRAKLPESSRHDGQPPSSTADGRPAGQGHRDHRNDTWQPWRIEPSGPGPRRGSRWPGAVWSGSLCRVGPLVRG